MASASRRAPARVLRVVRVSGWVLPSTCSRWVGVVLYRQTPQRLGQLPRRVALLTGEGAHQVGGLVQGEQAEGHGGGQGVPSGGSAAGGQMVTAGQGTQVGAQVGRVLDVVEDQQPA